MDAKKVGSVFRCYRETLFQSQQDIADALSCKKYAIVAIEIGRKLPKLDEFVGLCRHFGKSLDAVLSDIESEALPVVRDGRNTVWSEKAWEDAETIIKLREEDKLSYQAIAEQYEVSDGLIQKIVRETLKAREPESIEQTEMVANFATSAERCETDIGWIQRYEKVLEMLQCCPNPTRQQIEHIAKTCGVLKKAVEMARPSVRDRGGQ